MRWMYFFFSLCVPQTILLLQHEFTSYVLPSSYVFQLELLWGYAFTTVSRLQIRTDFEKITSLQNIKFSNYRSVQNKNLTDISLRKTENRMSSCSKMFPYVYDAVVKDSTPKHEMCLRGHCPIHSISKTIHLYLTYEINYNIVRKISYSSFFYIWNLSINPILRATA